MIQGVYRKSLAVCKKYWSDLKLIFFAGEKRVRIQKLCTEVSKARALNGRYVMMAHNKNNKRQILEKQLARLETSKEQNSAEIKRLGDRRNDVEIKEEEKIKEKNTFKQRLKSKTKEQLYRQNFLSKYKTQSLSRFGEQVIKLEKEIDDYVRDSNVFTKRPIGPLGRYVRLKGEACNDEKLAELLEIELGSGLLRSYICNCRQDRTKLEGIINPIWSNTTFKSPLIFTRTFSDNRYSEAMLSKFSVDVRENLFCVMDFLGFDNPNVFNLVVDQKQIEQVSYGQEFMAAFSNLWTLLPSFHEFYLHNIKCCLYLFI